MERRKYKKPAIQEAIFEAIFSCDGERQIRSLNSQIETLRRKVTGPAD